MHFTLNFVVALLATSALAAPTPKEKEHKSSHPFGSFKVPSRARPNHKQNVDTHHEMSRAFAKFDLDFILAKPDLKISSSKIDLSLPAIKNTPVKNAHVEIDLPDIPDIVGNLLDNFLPKHSKPGKSKTSSAPPAKKTSTLAAVSSAAPYISPVSSYYAPAPAPVSSSAAPPPPPPPPATTEAPTSSAAPVSSSPAYESYAPVVVSSAAPASSEPVESYAPPATSSAAPVESYVPPATSSAAPVESYVPPTTSSAAPVESYVPPATSSAAPVESYVPPVSSAAPVTSAPAPVSSTAAPVVSSAAPETSAPAPATSVAPAPTTFSSVYQPSFTFAPTTTQAAPVSTSKKLAATVHASPEKNQAEYLSPVKIGSGKEQYLNLNFDTGSADLWVFSNKLGADRTAGHTTFDHTQSTSWSPADGYTWKISYGDGSTASGDVGFDAVAIGGATATRQAVELATSVSDSFAKDVNNDGLVGLGWSNINTVKPQRQKTWFENIMADLDQPLFTADLRKDASGSYEFGTIDPAKYSGDIHYTPIDNSKGFWQFPSTSYAINGQIQQNPNAAPAIADTGTSITLADPNAVNAYYNQVQGASVSSTAGGWVFPCNAQLPDFGVAIGDSGFIATIPGSEMVYAKLDTAGTSCFGGVQSNAGISYQIYGATLLKQYFAVFNGGAKTFGLAKKTYA